MLKQRTTIGLCLLSAVLLAVLWIYAFENQSNTQARNANSVSAPQKPNAPQVRDAGNVDAPTNLENVQLPPGIVEVNFSGMTTPELLDLLVEACSKKDEGVLTSVEAELRSRTKKSYQNVLDRVFEYADAKRALPAQSYCVTRICALLAATDDRSVVESLVMGLRKLWLTENHSAATTLALKNWFTAISVGSPKTLLEKHQWVLISALYYQFAAAKQAGNLTCPEQLAAVVQELAARPHVAEKLPRTADALEFPDPWLSAFFSICADVPELAGILKPSAKVITGSSYFTWSLRRELLRLYNETPRSVYELADKITNPATSATASKDIAEFLLGQSQPTADELLVLAEALGRTGVAATGGAFNGTDLWDALSRSETARIADLMREAFAAFLKSVPGTPRACVLLSLLYDLSVKSNELDNSAAEERKKNWATRTRGAWLPPVSAEDRKLLTGHINGYWKEIDGRPALDGLYHYQLHVVLSEVDLDVTGSCALLSEHWDAASPVIALQSRYFALCRLMNRRTSTEMVSHWRAIVELLGKYLASPPERPTREQRADRQVIYLAETTLEILQRSGFPSATDDQLRNLWKVLSYLDAQNAAEGPDDSERRTRQSLEKLLQKLKEQFREAGYYEPK